MRWYINDTSLQGQFSRASDFLQLLEGLLSCRSRLPNLQAALYLTKSIAEAKITTDETFRQAITSSNNTELRRSVLQWLDRRGPFIEDDRYLERDDYFECYGYDVTDNGLGEAARRAKAGMPVLSFSFKAGNIDFATTPLPVYHGIPEDRIGNYNINNLFELDGLETSALNSRAIPANWEQLVHFARAEYENLTIPDTVFSNPALSKEPFEIAISDRALALLKHLNDYMGGRAVGGIEGPAARQIIDDYFTGSRALFSGESPTNQDEFRAEMTFQDPANQQRTIFAHWHGKISRRYFRLHFEWPIAPNENKLKILYLGPKITKR